MADTSTNNLTVRSLTDDQVAFDLSAHVQIDLAGYPDWMRCQAMDQITAILDYHPHVVTQEEEGSFDLFAFNYYGTERLYWVIMVYNGLANYDQVRMGMTIRIPVGDQVKQILTNLTSKTSQQSGNNKAAFIEI